MHDLTIVQIQWRNLQLKSQIEPQCFKLNHYTSNRIAICVQVAI